jgi:hypothetical protein
MTQIPVLAEILLHRQPSHNLLHHRVRPCRDLLWRLVLNGMLHVNRVKARSPERAGLDACGRRELSGCDRHSRDTQVF